MADYISREAALDCFSDWIDRYGHEHTADEMTEYQRIEDLPVADVRPVRKAKWECSEHQGLWFSRCSGDDGCGGYVPGCTSYRFCPNCGADMREEKSE